MDQEKTQKQDRDGRRLVEEAQWEYQFKYGKALAMDGQFDVAEREFNSVLEKPKIGSIKDAKWEFYRAAVQLENTDEQDETDYTWTLRNAKSYAQILLEEKEYNKAMIWLRDIWLHRHKAARWYASELEKAVITSACSLIDKERLTDAFDFLTYLQQGNSNDDHEQSPPEHQILVLLAYVHLMRGKLEAAEASAAAMFDILGVASVFQSSESINVSNFHHADTLILAWVKQDKKEKYHQAKTVWDEIYKRRNHILTTNKGQLKKHVTTGLTLADEWEKSCKKEEYIFTSGSTEVGDGGAGDGRGDEGDDTLRNGVGSLQ